MTPQEKERLARKLEAEAALASGTGSQAPRKKQQTISPRTKLPVEHPESQAVECAHYEMQTSLNSRPMTEAELAALLERPKE